MRMFALFVLAAALLTVLLWILTPRGPRLEELRPLLEPHLRQAPDQRVLVVEAKGDPKASSQGAFGRLFKAYGSLKGVEKSWKMPAPRARWALPAGTDPAKWETVPPSEWTGFFALPLPEAVSSAPSGSDARVELWHYGTIAEILHVGPYDAELPSIEKLKAFIQAQGLVIAGAHEEEYLKGPGWILRGDPAGYLTLIRYPVKPKAR
jgi:hypothetical protein